MPINMDIEYPKLKAENTILKTQLEAALANKVDAMRLACEFGYKQHENGNNLETALINFDKTINGI